MEQAQVRTSEDFANQQQSQKRKRRRDHLSCQLCRVRKVACDRQRPCMTCLVRKCADECVYDETREPSATITQEQNASDPGTVRVQTESTEERLARLESKLRVLADNRARPDHQNRTARGRSNTSMPRFSHQDDYKRPTFVERTGRDATFCLAQHSWTFPCSQDMMFMWKSIENYTPEWTELKQLQMFYEADHRRGLGFFTIAEIPNTESMEELRAQLPARSTCDLAMTRFLITFNKTHPIVSRAVFEQQAANFWSNDPQYTHSWLVLYTAVIATGLEVPVEVEGIPSSGSRKHGRALKEIAHKFALHELRISKRPGFTLFQTFLVLAVSEKLMLGWVDAADATSGIIGILTRIAAVIGLHRDPSMNPGFDEDEIEIRRTVYWTFVWTSFEHSLDSGIPWHSSNGDVEIPRSDSGWKRQAILRAALVSPFARTLQIFHNKRSFDDRQEAEILGEIDDIYLGHSDLMPIPLSSSAEASTAQSFAVEVQRAIMACLTLRIQILLRFRDWRSADDKVRRRAESEVLEAAVQLIDWGLMVSRLVPGTSEAARNIWTEFVISNLRTHLYYGSAMTMLILRRAHNHDSSTRSNILADAYIGRMRSLQKVQDIAMSISWESVKHQLVHWAQLNSLIAELEAPPSPLPHTESTRESRVNKDPPIVDAAKKAMRDVCERARSAIIAATSLEDPPPNLLSNPSSALTSPSSIDPGMTASVEQFMNEWGRGLGDWFEPSVMETDDLWTQSQY